METTEPLQVGGMAMTFGAKAGRYFHRMALTGALWRRELNFYPRSQPCFSQLSTVRETERLENGKFIVPVTAGAEVAALDPAEIAEWWHSVHHDTEKWRRILTFGLVRVFTGELRDRFHFLMDHSEFLGIETVAREIREAGSVEQLVVRMCVLNRIHLAADGTYLQAAYGFDCSWDPEHEVDVIFENDCFVRSTVGR